MKWQNLTNKICGSVLSVLLLASLPLVRAVAGQEKKESPLILKKCWSTYSEDPAKNMLASDNGLALFLAKTGSTVEAVDSISGRQIWQSELGGDIVSNLAADPGNLFVATTQGAAYSGGPKTTILRSISIVTGIPAWSRALPYSENFFLADDENFVFIVSADGLLAAFKKSDGSAAWQNPLGKPLAGVLQFTGKSLILATEPGEIAIVSLPDGSLAFQLKTGSAPTSVYMTDDRTLVWGDGKGNVSAVDIPTKTVKWKFKSGGSISGIAGTKEAILITSYDNFLYLMSPGGRVLWKRRLPGRLAEKPLVTGEFAIVSVVGEPGASFIDLGSGKLLNRISPDDGTYMTAAPVAVSGMFVFSSEAAIYSFSAGDCLPKK